MSDRRAFLKSSLTAAAGGAVLSAAGPAFGRAARRRKKKNPAITFYGAAGRVSGSCHILETSSGLYLVDCGVFMSDTPDRDTKNAEFPFDPKDVKAVFLTHAHADHNARLPLLSKKGFRGPVYCTDATRDLNAALLRGTLTVGGRDEDDEDETATEAARDLYGRRDKEKTLGAVEAVPYNTRLSRSGVDVRFTDAGHILGSAMVEVWADGRKILFGGDTGPDHDPLLHAPARHTDADAVLFESTYGAVRDAPVDYEDFGRRVAAVVKRGGSVLLPCFALHKTQVLISVLLALKDDGVIPKGVPVFSDSGSAAACTEVYDAHPALLGPAAAKLRGARGGSLFYHPGYYEARVDDTLLTHGGAPAIYISTSGMLDHAAAPRHLAAMAEDPKNAVFLVGYQAPGTIGSRVQRGESPVRLPIEVRGEPTAYKTRELKLEVDTLSGFSSHAKGEQILNWLGGFDSVGPAYVVHGDPPRAEAMAEAAGKMGVEATAVTEGQTFEVTGDRVTPGDVPALPAAEEQTFEPADR